MKYMYFKYIFVYLFFSREGICKGFSVAHLAKFLSGWDYYFSKINHIQLTKLM